jgi:hypothetical protein
VSNLRILFRAGLAKKGRFCERKHYSLRFAHRALHDPAVLLDAQDETTDHRGSITKDVPVLRIGHVSIEGKLFGVREALYSSCVLDFKEMNRRFAHVFPELFR